MTPPTARFGRRGAALLTFGVLWLAQGAQVINSSANVICWGSGSPEGVMTAPVGASYYNYGTTGFGQYMKSSGTGNTGWQAAGFQPFATASRPDASLAGIGGAYFDTTLGKPIWSNGTAWVDATGATV